MGEKIDTYVNAAKMILLAVIAVIAAFREPKITPPVPQAPPAAVSPAPTPPTVVPLPPPPQAPAPAPNPKGAICRIQFGNASCTATFIGPRRNDGTFDILSAAHCIRGKGKYGVAISKTHGRIKIKVTAADVQGDVCWLRTEQSIDHPFAILSSTNPEPGMRVWHEGYGVDRPGSHEEGVVLRLGGVKGGWQVRIAMSPGDSGSGLFGLDDGKVYGTIFGTINNVGSCGGAELATSIRPTD